MWLDNNKDIIIRLDDNLGVTIWPDGNTEFIIWPDNHILSFSFGFFIWLEDNMFYHLAL
jgi:hypothetical protein